MGLQASKQIDCCTFFEGFCNNIYAMHFQRSAYAGQLERIVNDY
jgi:hypothetical protein